MQECLSHCPIPAKQQYTRRRSVDDTDKHGLRIKGPKTERGKRTITIDDDLIALLLAERERHLRIVAGVPDGVSVDLSLVKLPAGALMFPSPGADLTKVRHPRAVTKEFGQRAKRVGFPGLRFHDLRGTHETLLLDRGVSVHVVAARCGTIRRSCCGVMPNAPARQTYPRPLLSGRFPKTHSVHKPERLANRFASKPLANNTSKNV
jgi:hypothetical protein